MGAETPGDTSPRFLGEAASAPGRFSAAGPRTAPSRRNFLSPERLVGEALPRQGGHPEAGAGAGRAEQGRGAAPGPPALLGPPASAPRDPGLDAGGRPSPAGGADSATWRPRAGRNPDHRGDRAVQRGPAPAQASRARSQAPLAALGLPLHQTPAVRGPRLSGQTGGGHQPSGGRGGRTRAHSRGCAPAHRLAQAPPHTHTDGDSGLTVITDPVFPAMRAAKDAVSTPGRPWAPTFRQVKAAFSPTSELGPRVHHRAAPGARGSGRPTRSTPPASTGVVRGAARACEHPERPTPHGQGLASGSTTVGLTEDSRGPLLQTLALQAGSGGS